MTSQRNNPMQTWRVCEFKLEIIREKCRWDTGESGNGVRIRELETLTFLARWEMYLGDLRGVTENDVSGRWAQTHGWWMRRNLSYSWWWSFLQQRHRFC